MCTERSVTGTLACPLMPLFGRRRRPKESPPNVGPTSGRLALASPGIRWRAASKQGAEGVEGTDKLAGEAASSVAGVVNHDELAVRPGAVQVPCGV